MKYIILSILSLFIFTSCTNKNISIEKKNEKINHLHGSIKLKDGTILAQNKIFYMLVVKNTISNKDFLSLKEDLTGIGNLTYKKFERAKKRFNKEEVLSYSLSKDDIEKINEIVSKYDNVIKNKTLYTQISGYQRVYPRTDLLSPFIGHIFKTDSSRDGRKGIEKYYNKQLENNKDITLNMNLGNLVKLEKEVDKLKKDLNAYEVSSITLDLDSGCVDSIASSNRYNPMAIRAKDIPYLDVTLTNSPFIINFLYEPIKSIEEEKNSLENLKSFGLLSKSDLDVSFEKLSSKINNPNEGNFSVNLMQLIKAYSVFYNDGILKNFKLIKEDSISQNQVIDKDLANEIKDTLESFYKSIENKMVLLNGRTSTIKFKYFKKDSKRYLKAYLIINNNDMKYYRCLINFENKTITSNNFFQITDKVSIIHTDYKFPENTPPNIYFKKDDTVYYHQMCKEVRLN